MRFLKAIVFVVTCLIGVLLFAGPAARAAQAAPPSPASPAPSPPPVQLAGVSSKLTQQSPGTWTTTVYINTDALCPDWTSFSFVLLTTSPFSNTVDTNPVYPVGNHPQCGALGSHPVTEVQLTFTPGLSSAPQSATLALTPSGPALAAGVIPLDIPLTVRRQVSIYQYLWIPLGCGVGLALLFAATALRCVCRRYKKTKDTDIWKLPLYAASAWTFGDSWATNISAIGALVGTVLTATGSISELLPGVELGRFSLLIALAGGVTAIAPLVFSVLNSSLGMADPATGMVAIGLPAGAPGASEVTINVPGGGTVTIPADPGAAKGGKPGDPPPAGSTIDIPAGAKVTVSVADEKAEGGADEKAEGGADEHAQGSADGRCQDVIVLPGGTEIAVTQGRQVKVGDTTRVAPAGATITFLGQATVTLPPYACVETPGDKPAQPPADASEQDKRKSDKKQRKHRKRTQQPGGRMFTVPRSGDVIVARLPTMIFASFLTVFGIGMEIGIIGIVLCCDLAAVPLLVQVLSAFASAVVAGLLVWYGVYEILALADSKDDSAMSNARSTSFIL